MVRRYLRTAVIGHMLYALFWISLSPHSRMVAERYAVTAAELVAVIFYGVLIIAFYEAQKTRLNLALAVQKLFWFLLILLLALPFQIGVLIHQAPYRTVHTPYALFVVPPWLRTYIWIGIAVSLIGVLYEFYRANWGDPTYPEIERRRNPYGRRATDIQPKEDVPA